MIKNIIFDVGNVLLKFNRDYLLGNFYKGNDYNYLKDRIFKDWEMMDDGTLTPEEHLNTVLSTLPQKYHQIAKGILTTWEDYMFPPEGINQLVLDLKNKGYKLYILSNMTDHFIKNKDKFPIFSQFNGIVFSAPIKMVKPNEDIYKYLFEKFNLNPNECLFIDDRKENLTTAARFSMKTFLFNDNVNELKNYILTI